MEDNSKKPGVDAETKMEEVKELLTRMVRALVDNPDDVVVNSKFGQRTIFSQIKVSKEDLGKVIGKGGSKVTAIRAYMSGVCGKDGFSFTAEVVE